MTCRIHLMPIELVVAQELLTGRVRGSLRLCDSDSWVEPCHDFGVRRAEQFTLAEALSAGHLWYTQLRVKPHDQTVKIWRSEERRVGKECRSGGSTYQ